MQNSFLLSVILFNMLRPSWFNDRMFLILKMDGGKEKVLGKA